jgi:triosephosphate isomerase (TIM)
MRVRIVAGKWKMNGTRAESDALARGVVAGCVDLAGVEVVVAPPFTALAQVAEITAGSSVAVAGQNMCWADRGPFTGEVSPLMLRDFATWVIVGHSERRHLFGESDIDVNRKVHAALHRDLQPIACVGETEAERDANQTDAVVARQLAAALEGLSNREAARAVVAYEPVWAIGTGRACAAEEAGRVARLARAEVARLFGTAAGDGVRILYGGSATPDNLAGYLAQPDVDGALIGGASLTPASFCAMAAAAGT